MAFATEADQRAAYWAVGLGGRVQLNDANAIYNFTTTVERLGGAAEVYLQRVTFTVTFSDGRSENFTTFVTRR